MANDLNHCSFIGRLGKDPELKYMPSGDAVVNISLAVGWKSKNAEGTEWVNVVVFGKMAEVIAQYQQKGSRMHISGKLRTRKWQDKDGNDHYTTEIVARDMQMLDSKSDQTAQPAQPAQPLRAVEPRSFPPGGTMEDDVPFNQIDWRLG